MLLSPLKYHQDGTIFIVQGVRLRCDLCGKEWDITDARTYLKQGEFNKCKSCISKGVKRGPMTPEAKKKISDAKKGRTWEMLYDAETVTKLRRLAADKITKYNKEVKGLSLEERLGEQKAANVRKIRSKNAKGKNNSMYGKPAPIGSGLGIQGWYKGWFFRSMKELSYMVNVIEKNGYTWKTGETKEFRIPYKLKGVWRNYFPDFIIGNLVIEIKPQFWIDNSDITSTKSKYAIKWCNKRGYTYQIISEHEYSQLSKDDLKLMLARGDISLKKGILL